MFDLISPAYAANAAGSQEVIGNVVFMLLLFAVFYFLLIRPQQKQAKAHKSMVESLARGDLVVIGSGIMGKIHRVEDDSITLDVGEVEVSAKVNKPVRMKVKKSSVTSVTTKSGAAPTAVPKK